jgi:hypothetical protein
MGIEQKAKDFLTEKLFLLGTKKRGHSQVSLYPTQALFGLKQANQESKFTLETRNGTFNNCLKIK